MKALIFATGLLALSWTNATKQRHEPGPIKAPSFSGAWLLTERRGQELSVGMNIVMLCTDNYAVYSCYDRVSRKFYYTSGGPYQTTGDKFKLKLEFNTQDSSKVGSVITYDYILKGKRVAFNTSEGEQIWERLDKPQALAGLWQIRSREQDGQMQAIRKGPRKTIKILSGTRFQWVAMNTDTKEFFGCGGGTYTFKDGKYTETIDFFSRDPERVGMSLTFDAKVTGKEWRHQSVSTTGVKVNEVWEKEN